MTLDVYEQIIASIWFLTTQWQLWYLRSKVLKLRDRIYELELDTATLQHDRTK